MKDALELRSKSGIHRLITALEERGFIRRLPKLARAIEVISSRNWSPRHSFQPQPRFHAECHQGNWAGARRLRGRGRPAGCSSGHGPDRRRYPIEAIQTRSHTISMPPELLTTGEHFALEVRGDLMIEAGILDGTSRCSSAPKPRIRRHRRRADRRRGPPSSASAGAAPPLRSNPPTPPTRSASCHPTASAFRANWSACSGGIEGPAGTYWSASKSSGRGVASGGGVALPGGALGGAGAVPKADRSSAAARNRS